MMTQKQFFQEKLPILKIVLRAMAITLQGQANWRALDEDGYLPAPPHDETGHTWHHSDTNLFLLTKYGVSYFTKEEYLTRMPRYETLLTDDEIIAVLSYIKSTWPQQIQTKQNSTNR